jgi:hypothetical protein
LRATSRRATLIEVLHRAVWLRLLVAALFCVVGVARSHAQRSEADAAKRANGPMHVSASTREGELTALRKRGAEPSRDDEASLADAEPELVAADRGCVDAGTVRRARPASASVERPSARGPPIA